jgi:hypothetical protein
VDFGVCSSLQFCYSLISVPSVVECLLRGYTGHFRGRPPDTRSGATFWIVFNSGFNSGTANHERFGLPVDDENEPRLFQKPWDSPISSRILRDSLGTVPVFEIFEADPGHAARVMGSVPVFRVGNAQTGFFNRVIFPHSSLTAHRETCDWPWGRRSGRNAHGGPI